MDTITESSFISDILKYHELSSDQEKNVRKLNDISKLLLSQLRINDKSIYGEISREIIVIDSGHQPNFFPYSGTWKKAFLLSWLQKRIAQSGKNVIAFFGFADQNLSTAKLLTHNHVPGWNKKGSDDIGIKIGEKDRFRQFCSLEKPSPDRWGKEMDKIKVLYKNNLKKVKSDFIQNSACIDQIMELLWQCYNDARTFSEVNCSIFIRICHEILGIDNIRFYTFSDLVKNRIFLGESKNVIRNYQQYNVIYNRTVTNKNLDLHPIAPDYLPFWYNCACGGTIDLSISGPGIWTGSCPLCRKEYHLDVGSDLESMDSYYKNMDFSAVSRNIVFASGMGSSLFLSGSGGALTYGIISEEISRELGYHRPVPLAWVSNDYYIGILHTYALQELFKTYNITIGNISDGSFRTVINNQLQSADIAIDSAKAKNESERVIKNFRNAKNNLVNVNTSAAQIFKVKPSFIDILVASPPHTITDQWNAALTDMVLQHQGNVYKLKKDITYNTSFLNTIKSDEIPLIYHMVASIRV